MINTNFTLSLYGRSCPCDRHNLYLPSISASLQTLGRVSAWLTLLPTYCATRDAYLKAANELKLATGPYKAARDAYVAATTTYTKSLYE